MANFSKDQNIKFRRNSLVFSDNTPIVAVVEKQFEGEKQTYIIESSYGWSPSVRRKENFSLQDNKKYLFVSESELTVI